MKLSHMPQGIPAPSPAPDPSPQPRWRSVLEAARPHQWAKNSLLFVPLVTSHELTNPSRLLPVLASFVAFSLCASGVYVVNDLLDLKSDRAHLAKRRRPFASGRLGVRTGATMAGLSVGAAFGLASWVLPAATVTMLALYVMLTTAYSLVLKRKLMLDVLMLAALYTHRILTGGVAAGISVSEWLLAFSMFFFLSLAFAKRYTELSRLPVEGEGRIQGRGYWSRDLDLVRTLGPTSGSLAVLVLVLYINLSPEVRQLYPAPFALYLVCPIVLYWISRIWFLAQRGQLDDDPVVFALRDRVSLVAGALTLAVLLLASSDLPVPILPR